jgi:lipoprotein NlpD
MSVCHPTSRLSGAFTLFMPVLLTLAISACSSPNRTAPILDRTDGASGTSAPHIREGAPAKESPANPVFASEQHVVRKGDTLYSIAMEHGKDPRDLALWNNIADPSTLRVGQALTLAPSGSVSENTSAGETGVQVNPITSVGKLETQPLAAPTPLPAIALPAAAKPESPRVESARPADEINWIWPVPGKVLDTFDASRNKGIDVAGKVGEPVMAASDGKVVYSGTGLRGYGNLVIVKHSETFLSAYAHNSKLLVNQGDPVKRGQKIAELGSSDADKPKLHFEIRREGQPVDPLKYLPAR